MVECCSLGYIVFKPTAILSLLKTYQNISNNDANVSIFRNFDREMQMFALQMQSF